jgi:hypothetical protein
MIKLHLSFMGQRETQTIAAYWEWLVLNFVSLQKLRSRATCNRVLHRALPDLTVIYTHDKEVRQWKNPMSLL